ALNKKQPFGAETAKNLFKKELIPYSLIANTLTLYQNQLLETLFKINRFEEAFIIQNLLQEKRQIRILKQQIITILEKRFINIAKQKSKRLYSLNNSLRQMKQISLKQEADCMKEMQKPKYGCLEWSPEIAVMPFIKLYKKETRKLYSKLLRNMLDFVAQSLVIAGMSM
ncbi:hypothetical protein ABPG72_000515, partial [Tetrahymena utriculariae]